MSQFIEIVGARENNLKNVSLNIPKQQITVFTGVSGSGKSSLVFDTLAAEAQRQLNETFTAFVQGFLPHYGQPDVESVEGLNAPIIIDQKRVGGGSRSTVGTYTDISAVLRLLFSRVGVPSAGPAYTYSFNTPQGMCPECEGIGKTTQLDLDRFLDRSKSLNGGALLHPDFKVGGWIWKTYAMSGLFDNDKPEQTARRLTARGIDVADGRFYAVQPLSDLGLYRAWGWAVPGGGGAGQHRPLHQRGGHRALAGRAGLKFSPPA